MKYIIGSSSTLLLLDDDDFLPQASARRLIAPEHYVFDANDLHSAAALELAKTEIVLLVSIPASFDRYATKKFLEVVKDHSPQGVEKIVYNKRFTHHYGLGIGSAHPGATGKARLRIDKLDFERICSSYLVVGASGSCKVETIAIGRGIATADYRGSPDDFQHLLSNSTQSLKMSLSSNPQLAQTVHYKHLQTTQAQLKQAESRLTRVSIGSAADGVNALPTQPEKDSDKQREMDFFLTKTGKPSTIWDD